MHISAEAMSNPWTGILVHRATLRDRLERSREEILARLLRGLRTCREPSPERGQHAGTFRPDVPATWHLSTLLAIIHTASGEQQADRMPTQAIESALVATMLGALGAGTQ